MSDSSRRIYTGRVVTLDVSEVTLPNGHRATLEIVGHPGGAAVVAVNAADEVCLLHQYRHVAGGWLWEIPAGKLDGKTPEATARAELAEEAGLTATEWQSLGRIHSSPGVFGEVVHLFLARGLAAVTAAPEREEVFEVRWVPLKTAVARALAGEISDAKSVVALLRAADRLGARR
ncbi:MAG TPA: NUDIX hydrolase [Steroidobacteraceae bacterium]|nr:NUDIX hydrolase [Steroidobacteraceae bacterium]